MSLIELTGKPSTLAHEQQIDFVDLFPLFTEKGTHVLRKELSTDGLHLNEKGYKIWAKELKKRW